MEREESEEGGPRRAARGRAREDHRVRAAPVRRVGAVRRLAAHPHAPGRRPARGVHRRAPPPPALHDPRREPRPFGFRHARPDPEVRPQGLRPVHPAPAPARAVPGPELGQDRARRRLRVPRREPLRQGPADRRGVRHRRRDGGDLRRDGPDRRHPSTPLDPARRVRARAAREPHRAARGALPPAPRHRAARGFSVRLVLPLLQPRAGRARRAALPRLRARPGDAGARPAREAATCPSQLLRRAAADPEWAPEPLVYWLLARSGQARADEAGTARVGPDLARLRVQIAELARRGRVVRGRDPAAGHHPVFPTRPVVPARLQPPAPVPEEPLHLRAEGPRRRAARAAARHHPRAGHQPQDPGAAEDLEARRAAVLPRESRVRSPCPRAADLPARAQPDLHRELPARPVQGPDPGGGHAARQHRARQQPHHAEPHHPAHLDARRPGGAHRAVRPHRSRPTRTTGGSWPGSGSPSPPTSWCRSPTGRSSSRRTARRAT